MADISRDDIKKILDQGGGTDSAKDNMARQLQNLFKQNANSNRGGGGSTTSSLEDMNNVFKQTANTVRNLSNASSTWNQNIFDVADNVRNVLGSVVSIFDTSVSVGDTFKSIATSVLNMATPFLDLDQALRDGVNQELGITGGLARDLRQNITGAAAELLKYGIETRDTFEMMKSIVETTNRAIPLSTELYTTLGKEARAAGITLRAAGEFSSNLEGLGLSLTKGPELINDMAETARTMGLSSTKFITYAAENLKLINTLGFKDGIKGFTQIAAKASLIKFNLENAATKANELFDPENAIELAAQLNVLGGEFGRLGNAVDLMFMPTNDMEGFTQAIMDAQKQFVSFNQETGDFEATPLDLRRAREFAKAMGKDVNTVIEEAKRSARQDLIKDRISIIPGLSEEDRDLIGALGTINENGQVEIKGKTVTELSSDELQKQLGRLRQESEKGTMSTEEILNEQMNLAKKANVYLRGMALALGVDTGIMKFLGDDFNDLFYELKEKVPTFSVDKFFEDMANGNLNSQDGIEGAVTQGLEKQGIKDISGELKEIFNKAIYESESFSENNVIENAASSYQTNTNSVSALNGLNANNLSINSNATLNLVVSNESGRVLHRDSIKMINDQTNEYRFVVPNAV